MLYGPNEAGKSSLHAALYLGLCGLRRGKGKTDLERDFERHRPWDGGGWKVSVVVRYEDGRRVEIIQDLDGKVGCKALDADLGREYPELLHDGTPDGALWLGLDRRAFLATACVRQAQLLEVLKQPAVLQDHLQRAVAVSGGDSTAAAALQRLESFQKEQVGQNRAHSTKPLRQAHERLDRARTQLEAARRDHHEYLQLLAREDVLEAGRAQAEARLWVASAALAWREAHRLEAQLERARELWRRFPDGRPAGLVADGDRAARVTRALHAWDTRPEPVVLAGRSAGELRRALLQLEEPAAGASAVRAAQHVLSGEARATQEAAPGADAVGAAPLLGGSGPAAARRIGERSGGDQAPAAEVLQARTAFLAARLALDDHGLDRPPAARPAECGAATADELRQLAAALGGVDPQPDARLAAERAEAERRRDRLEARRRRRGLVGVGAGLVVGGAVLAFVGTAPGRTPWLGLGLGLMAVGAVGLVLGRRRPDRAALRQVQLDLERLAARLRDERTGLDAARERRQAAVARALDLGAPADAAALAALADDRERFDRETQRLAAWDDARARHRARLDSEAQRLRQLLQEHGVAPSDDLEDDARRYERDCERRAQRAGLEAALRTRQREEDAAARGAALSLAAEAAVLAAARDCGLEASDPAACVAALRAWEVERSQRLERQEEAIRDWTTLEGLLDGRTLEQLETHLDHKRAAAGFYADLGLPEPEVAAAELDGATTEETRERLREAVNAAAGALQALRAEKQLREAQTRCVADAEEEVAAAQRELERVQQLDATLQRTRDALAQAQAHVHRSIAPLLVECVQGALPDVTLGRYREVRVDPETLEVQVRTPSGTWHEAALLSHGTAEQVYLLLRVALARHLTRKGEVCPLLLDDVTVQSDGHRTHAILATLQALARERQVVLLTQEDEVVAWAEEHLRAPDDRVVRLGGPGAD